MARREIDYVVSDEGRDKGKVFHITEMSSIRAEKWAMRTMRAMLMAGIPVTPEMMAGGIGSLATMNPLAIMNVDMGEVFALGDELMTCVQIRPDKSHPELLRTPDAEGDIEEIKTRLNLKLAAYHLIVGFSPAAVPST